MGYVRYPNSPGTPAAVGELMATFLAHPGHAFWPDAVTLLDRQRVDATCLFDSAHAESREATGRSQEYAPRRTSNGKISRGLHCMALGTGRRWAMPLRWRVWPWDR